MELKLDVQNKSSAEKNSSADTAVDKSGTVARTVGYFDRRRDTRPDSPAPSRTLAIQLFTDVIAKFLFATQIRASIFVGLQLLFVALIVWSVVFRYDGLANPEIKQQELANLRLQLDDLKSQWSDAELEKIESNLSQAQARVFEDFTSFASWLRGKARFAEQLDMVMTYRIGKYQHTRLLDTVSLPVYMSLKMKSENADDSYIRSLEFVRSLIDENLRVEIYGNEIKSSKKGITSVDLSIYIWVRGIESMNTTNEAGQTESTESVHETFIQ